ncbi:MAG TPA: hypothetical protein VKI43_04580 [Vicinamibacterales bacterium]|nr:hypothetical protein [Vicinamibacterales bacterium]
MTSIVSREHEVKPERSSKQANALADRLEQGARALAGFASGLTDAEWRSPFPRDGRTVGVIVHHVASVYPVEIQLAQIVAGGQPVTGIVTATIDEMNAGHATEFDGATREATLDLLRRNRKFRMWSSGIPFLCCGKSNRQRCVPFTSRIQSSGPAPGRPRCSSRRSEGSRRQPHRAHGRGSHDDLS